MPECEIPSPLDPDARWPEGLCIRARAPADAPGITALHNMAGFRYGTLRWPHQNPEDIRKGIETQSANSFALIAILDDDPDIRRLLADTLEDAGFRTASFGRAQGFICSPGGRSISTSHSTGR